jgi:hypothetical protein
MFQASPRKFCLSLSLLALVLGLAVEVNAGEPRNEHALQELVNRMKARLAIDAVVVATIVPYDPLLVSVQRVDHRADTFRMQFEEQFLTRLNDDDIEAIVAHELGHVWIFMHHPYLQTERLANTVAMRAVPRDRLERIYSKVWEREGTKGNLERFLGPQ